MKTKRLHMKPIVLFIGLVLSLSTSQAATWYYCGAGAINNTLSWYSTSNCTGVSHPGSFTGAVHTWRFVGGVAYSLPADFVVRRGSTIEIGAVAVGSATLTTNGFKIKGNLGSGNVTVNVRNAGQLIVNTADLLGGNNAVFGTFDAGTDITFNLAGAIIGVTGFTPNFDNLTILADATLNGNGVNVASALTNSAILTMAGGSLNVSGTMAGAGTISGDNAAVFILSGGGSQTLNMDQTTPGTTNLMNQVQNTGLGTLVIGNNLNIAAGGDITPVSGTIDASGVGVTVTLLADQSGAYTTGAIGDMTGGVFLGNITSQIYHNPNSNMTDWTMMGGQGINAPASVFTAWNTAFIITCATCPNGSTAGGGPFTSISFYNEALGGAGPNDAAHYVDLQNITDPLAIGQGVWVYEGTSSPGTPSAGELISMTGSPYTGNLSKAITVSNGSYNLLANPYPSPISWNLLYNNATNNTKMSDTYWTYSPNFGDNVYYNATTGISTPAAGNWTTGITIPTGMAFFVLASSASSIDFDEVVKVPGNSQALLKTANPNAVQSGINVKYFAIAANGFNMGNETSIAFDGTLTTGWDPKVDTKKTSPGSVGRLQVTTCMNGIDYALNGMPDLTSNYSIPVKMTTGTTGTYAISGVNLQYMPAGACIILHDNYTSTDYDLRNGPHNITLNDTETVARFVVNITITTSTITSSQTAATCPAGGDARLIALGGGSGPWNYTWKNSNSTIVKISNNKASADTLAGLSSGVYSVDVNTVGSCDNASQAFTLSLPGGTASAFTVSSNTVLVNNPLNFTDNSVNADAWLWDFGDENTSTQQNPVYTYTTTGNFDAVLLAINSACGDTVMSTVANIDVLGATGVANHSNDGLIVSKDEAGAFVKFNYTTQSKVNITVYNAMGQIISNTNSIQVMTDKIYLDLSRAKNQMLFISITNFENNTQVTKKLFND